MLGKTHMVVGIAATLAVTQPQNMKELVLGVGVGALGALIPDIDVGTSQSHKDADRVVILAVVVIAAALCMDHFMGTGIVSSIRQNSGLARIIIGAIIFIGACAFGKEQPHRSFMHSFLALVILSASLGLIWKDLIPYFAIGFISHLATDILNRKKVRLLYPLEGGLALGLFHAHGLANTVMFSLGTVAAVAETVFFAARILNIIHI